MEETLEFSIHNLPPQPRNRSHSIRQGMLIKTDLCRAFEDDLKQRLTYFNEKFAKFCKKFDTKKHYIKLEMTIFTPTELLFTAKGGGISSRSVDFDAHKCFVDVIFKAININDKYVREAIIKTPESILGTWNYNIKMTIKPIEDLYA